MKKFADFIVKHKNLILILTIILLVPSLIGYKKTKINYDILVYLPEDIETIKGENILTNEFNMGAFSISMIENMSPNKVLKLESDIKKIEGVEKVVSLYDVIGTTIPMEMLPSEVIEKVHKDNTDILFITFSEGTSNEKTLEAVDSIRAITKDSARVSGMSAMVLDTMNLAESEITIYIVIAVILCLIVLMLSLDSYVVPVILLLNIGISILFNLGSNIIFGEISYITKALVAVLQLGVTTDFSIFLYHAYERERENKSNNDAMKKAICDTFSSVMGSSLTTMAGFLVLCTMKLTLGKDLGLVMAKGVLLGVITVLTVFPSLILTCNKIIDKTKHKSILPKFSKLNDFIIKHYKKIFVIFIIILIPTYLAYNKVSIYYKLDESLPKTLDSIVANTELKEKFKIVSPEIILVDKDMDNYKLKQMIEEIKNTQGIDLVLSFNELETMGLSRDMLSSDLKEVFMSDKYQMILINSVYEIASDELNSQVSDINNIIDKYDKSAILAGEGPLMKDLVSISDTDFNNVNASSIIIILIIMLLVLKNISLPILLMITIEGAIFINMSIPYFNGNILPFVAPIVLGTIQLGATIDYAILISTNYIKFKNEGQDKFEAIKNTIDSSVSSIVVSGLCFFGATFGVGVYSDLEMISSLCTLISRGAIISMIVVIFVLPTILLIFDKLIGKTTLSMKRKDEKMKKNKFKKGLALSVLLVSLYTMPVQALTKEETVYAKLDSVGNVKNIIVNEYLNNKDKLDSILDESDLLDIININGDETLTKENKKLTWNSSGNDIYYQGTIKKDLPIKLDLEYTLDNKKISLDELLGKSGKVSINIKFTNNDKHIINNEVMYTPFVVTTGLIIKGENNSNITINNGKVISTGKNALVVGLSAPGLYESLRINELKGMNQIKIEFDTKKFELPNIYFVVTPKLLESDDLKIFDKMNELYKNVDDLKKGIDEIEAGTTSLVNGLGALNNAANALKDNIKLLDEGAKNLKNGTVSLDNGIKTLHNLIKSSKDEVLKMNNSNSMKDLESATKIALESTYGTPVYDLLIENTTSLNKLNQAFESATNTIIKNKNMINVLSNNLEENQNMIKLLEQYNSILSATLPNSLYSILDSLDVNLSKLSGGSTTVVNGMNNLYNGIDALYSKTPELVNGINKAYLGATTLNTGVNKYNNDGITKINNLVNTKVKPMQNKINLLVNLSENYTSFTTKSKYSVNSTKFIISIEGKKEVEVKSTPKATLKKTSLWTRIKNLFK